MVKLLQEHTSYNVVTDDEYTINEFCLCQLLVTCHGTTGFMHAKPLTYIEKYYQLRKIFNNSIFFFQMPWKHSSPKARVKVEFDQGPSRPPPPSKLDIDLGKIPPPTPSRRSSLATAKTLFGALNTSNIHSSAIQ
jgi:hypothetical protein